MIDLGTEGKHLMEIVAIDEDDRADGQGKAGLTWLSKTLLNTAQKLNNTRTSSGGYESCSLRSYLQNTIKPLIPSEVRNALVEVTKVQSTRSSSGATINGQTSTEDVWIPSVHEMISSNTSNETTGATYSEAFTSDNNRVKKLNNVANFYWLRSATSTSKFCFISNAGASNSAFPESPGGIALGFCTN